MMIYCIIPLSYYLSAIFTIFYETRRKDHWTMFAHHVSAFLGILVGFVIHRHLPNVMIMVIHDCADCFIEMAKSLKYAGLKRSSNVVFFVFAFAWITTRMFIFPQILYVLIFKAPSCPAAIIHYGCGVILLCMHTYWSYMTLKVVKKIISSNDQAYKDLLSSSEIEDN